MNEFYAVPREELLELLEAQYRFIALERGGVDNWSWYEESNYDFLKDYVNENEVFLTLKMNKETVEDFDFNDIAEFELGSYEKVEE